MSQAIEKVEIETPGFRCLINGQEFFFRTERLYVDYPVDSYSRVELTLMGYPVFGEVNVADNQGSAQHGDGTPSLPDSG